LVLMVLGELHVADTNYVRGGPEVGSSLSTRRV